MNEVKMLQNLDHIQFFIDNYDFKDAYEDFHDLDKFKKEYTFMVRKHETDDSYYAKDVFGNYTSITFENKFPKVTECCEISESISDDEEYYLFQKYDIDLSLEEYTTFKTIRKLHHKFEDGKNVEPTFRAFLLL